MGEAEVASFLSHLANDGRVAASTQNQALGVLLYLDKAVLDRPLAEVRGIEPARRPERLPVVLDLDEVRAVLARLDGVKWLMAGLLYGSGLRLMECLRLRVKDVEFGAGRIVVRDGKGAKDRVTATGRGSPCRRGARDESGPGPRPEAARTASCSGDRVLTAPSPNDILSGGGRDEASPGDHRGTTEPGLRRTSPIHAIGFVFLAGSRPLRRRSVSASEANWRFREGLAAALEVRRLGRPGGMDVLIGFVVSESRWCRSGDFDDLELRRASKSG
jgi:hypothetical protein